jgi:hypothetical protein
LWQRTCTLSQRLTGGFTALFCLALLPVRAAENALRFSGANQYVELPFGEDFALDNNGPGFSLSASADWTESLAADEFSGSSLQTTNADATATWTPLLPRAGSYEVYARWSGVRTNGTRLSQDTAAQFIVKDVSGLTTNVVNQSTNSGEWVLLGGFNFTADRTEFITLRRGDTNGGPTVADAVRFVTKEAFNVTSALTLEAWVNVSSFDKKFQAIITKGEAWGLMRYDDTDQLTFQTSDGTNVFDLVSSAPLPRNSWHHVAAVYDGARKSLYIDGVLSSEANYTAPLAQNLYAVVIGGNAEISDRFFLGDIDNARVWAIARSASELQAYRTNHLRGSEAGLLGEWRFDEGAGTNALDSSRHALHGKLRKSASPPSYVAGVNFGPPLPDVLALQFDGYSHEVGLLMAPKFDFTNRFTVEAWVNLDFPPVGTAALISKGADAWELAVAPNGKVIFRTDGVTAEDPNDPTKQVPAPELVSKSRLDAGEWTHVAAVWDGASGKKEIYVNGQLDETATNLQGVVRVNAQPVLLAARPTATGHEAFYRGLLDEVRLWNSARTSQQITDNFPRNLNRTEPGLVGFWDFNEGDGLVAKDGHSEGAIDGMLASGMSNHNRVAGRAVGFPIPLQYSLALDGVEEYVRIALTNGADVFNLTNLTIEAWIKPTGSGFRNILMKGDHGYGLAIDGQNYLRYFIDTTTQNSLRSSRPLEPERDADGNVVFDTNGAPVIAWNHVGVVVDRAANTTTFYINGKPAGSHASSVVRNNTGPIILGRQGAIATGNYFQGLLDEVRLWNVPRSSLEVELFAFNQVLGMTIPGLIGYWTFNEGSGAVAHDRSGGGRDGALVNMDLSNWREGTDWGVPQLPEGVVGLTPNRAAAGLWVGQVEVTKVNEVQKAISGASEIVTNVADRATIRILLHVAANGQVRMLKDVIVLKKGGAETNGPVLPNPLPPVDVGPTNLSLVLVTKPELIPNYQGIAHRGGKLVGVRYGTVAYDFVGNDLPMLGGVGPGAACMGRIELGKNHPTNPYRHKYHPDHRSGFDLTRLLMVHFDGAPGDPLREGPGFGVERLTGLYQESIIGLHKIPLKVEGTITLNRVNTVGVLNDGL